MAKPAKELWFQKMALSNPQINIASNANGNSQTGKDKMLTESRHRPQKFALRNRPQKFTLPKLVL